MEKRDMLVTAYAVPDIVTEEQTQALKERGFGVEKADVKIESYSVSAAIISREGWSAAEALDTFEMVFAGSKKELQTDYCLLGDRRIPYLTWKQGEVAFHDDGPERSKNGFAKERIAINAYTEILRRFSRYVGGAGFHYHYGGGATRAPFPDEAGVFRIFGAAGPPGESNERDASTVCGELIHSSGQSYRIHGPTFGRGIVIVDEDDGPVVQLIGSNFYFLPPILSCFHEPASPHIFRELLKLAWNEYRRQRNSPAPEIEKSATSEEFVASAECWSLEIREDWKLKLVEYDAQIESLQKTLGEFRRVRRATAQMLASFESLPLAQEVRERLPKDYEAIKDLPDVHRLAIVENGLHVETKPLIGEHDGKRYLLGSYVIRIGRYGALSVWQEKTVHPKGVPHPHIRKDGAICLGNASDTLAKSASKHRYFDTIAMMLRVLKHGYEPNDLGGVTRIEEWPLVETIEDLPPLVAEQSEAKTAETTPKEAQHGTAA